MAKFNLKKIFAEQKEHIKIRMGNRGEWEFDEQKYIWDKSGKLKKDLYENTKIGNHFIRCFCLSDGNKWTDGPFLMKDTDYLKVMTSLYIINNDYVPISYYSDVIVWKTYDNFVVAEDITPKQLRKFRLNSYNEVMDKVYEWTHFYGYGEKFNEFMELTLKRRKWYNSFKQELEYAKYNPRHLLGQLEFDRRAEEDGIKFADEEEEETKVHKCSDCNLWVSPTESCYCDEEEEE